MSKTSKASLLLLLLAISISTYLAMSAQKVDTAQIKINDSLNKIVPEEIVMIPIDIQEDRYAEDINRITEEYQSFIDSIDQQDNTKELDSETSYVVFGQNDKITINGINENLKNISVPSKYKEFHLLLSRSLLKLSAYINTSNPKDMLAGLELFEEAREEYMKLDIG